MVGGREVPSEPSTCAAGSDDDNEEVSSNRSSGTGPWVLVSVTPRSLEVPPFPRDFPHRVSTPPNPGEIPRGLRYVSSHRDHSGSLLGPDRFPGPAVEEVSLGVPSPSVAPDCAPRPKGHGAHVLVWTFVSTMFEGTSLYPDRNRGPCPR